jgi:hypothetical protein
VLVSADRWPQPFNSQNPGAMRLLGGFVKQD